MGQNLYRQGISKEFKFNKILNKKNDETFIFMTSNIRDV